MRSEKEPVLRSRSSQTGGEADDKRAERHPGDGQRQDDPSAEAVGQWADDDPAKWPYDKPDCQ